MDFIFNSKIIYSFHWLRGQNCFNVLFLFSFPEDLYFWFGELYQIKPKLGQKQKTVIVRKIEMCFSLKHSRLIEGSINQIFYIEKRVERPSLPLKHFAAPPAVNSFIAWFSKSFLA